MSRRTWKAVLRCDGTRGGAGRKGPCRCATPAARFEPEAAQWDGHVGWICRIRSGNYRGCHARLVRRYMAMRPVFDCRWQFAVVNRGLEPLGVSGRVPDRPGVCFNLATRESRWERVPADRGRYAAFWLRVVASGRTGSRARTHPSAGAQIGSSVLYAVAGNSPANSHFAPEGEHSHEVVGGKTPEWAAGSAPS